MSPITVYSCQIRPMAHRLSEWNCTGAVYLAVSPKASLHSNPWKFLLTKGRCYYILYKLMKSWVRAGSSVGQSDGLTSRRSQVQALSRLPINVQTPSYRTRSVAWLNTSACHAEDRGFKSRRVRQFISHLNHRLFGRQTVCGFLLSIPLSCSHDDSLSTEVALVLDLKFIRRNPDAIRTMLEQRRMAAPLDQLLEMDSRWREAVTGVENARHHQNTISKGIAQLKMNKQDASEQIAEMKQLSQEIKSLNKQSNILRQQIDEMLLTIPNLPDESTPVGGSEEDNVEIKRWGHPRTFDFEPRPHWELAEELDIVDFGRGTKIAGSNFILFKGLGARLERGLINFMIDLHVLQTRLYRNLPAFSGQSSDNDRHRGSCRNSKKTCIAATGTKKMKRAISFSFRPRRYRSPIFSPRRFWTPKICRSFSSPTLRVSGREAGILWTGDAWIAATSPIR